MTKTFLIQCIAKATAHNCRNTSFNKIDLRNLRNLCQNEKGMAPKTT